MEIEITENNALEELNRLRRVIGYKTDDPNSEPCFYCGCPATEKEHTVPIAYIEELHRLITIGLIGVEIPEQKIVPTCIECNRLVRDRYLGSPKQRKNYIKTKIAQKYKKLLESPQWCDDEILELEGRLKEHIVIYQELRKLILARLRY